MEIETKRAKRQRREAGRERARERERGRAGREGEREGRKRVTGTDRELKSMNICRGNGLKL